MRTNTHRRQLVVAPEPIAFETDPYVLDETTLTLEGWEARAQIDDGVEIVHFHQHHSAQLVA